MSKTAGMLAVFFLSGIVRAQTLAEMAGTYALSIESNGEEITFSRENDSVSWNYRAKYDQKFSPSQPTLRSFYLELDSLQKNHRLIIYPDSTYQYWQIHQPLVKERRGSVKVLDNFIFLFSDKLIDPVTGASFKPMIIYEYKVIDQQAQLKSVEKDYSIYVKEP
jgi:hypothetical protein